VAQLNHTQAVTLYGLCRYPHLRDVELARRINLARSTFSATKAQLVKDGIVVPAYFPDFGALGCELMAFTYIDHVRDENLIILLEETLGGQELPQMVHLVTESSKGLGLAYYRNFTEYDAVSETLTCGLLEKGRQPSHHDVLFPLFNTIHLSRFEFAGVVNRVHGLGFSDPYPPVEATCPLPRSALRASQRQVMVALSREPSATDRDLVQATGLSLPTIARSRRELVEGKYLQRRWLPRQLGGLGLNLLTMVHARLDPTINLIKRVQTLQRLLHYLTPHLFVSRSWEIFLLAPFIDFSDCQHHLNQLMAELWGEGLLLVPPTTLLLDVGKVRAIRHFAFAPLLCELAEAARD